MKRRKKYVKQDSWRRKVLSVVLSLAVVMTLLPVMPVKEVKADAETAARTLEPTVENEKVTGAKVLSFAGKEWYVIGCNGKGVLPAEDSVTTSDGDSLAVLLAKDTWGSNVKFDQSRSSNAYGSSNLKATIVEYESGITTAAGNDWSGIIKKRILAGGGQSGYGYQDQDNISDTNAVADVTLWPLSAAEAGKIDMTKSFIGQEASVWWLRSPGSHVGTAAVVYGGSGGSGGVDYIYVIRVWCSPRLVYQSDL